MIVDEYSKPGEISKYDLKKIGRSFLQALIGSIIAGVLVMLPQLEAVFNGYVTENYPALAVMLMPFATSLVEGIRRFMKDYSSER